MVVRRVIECVCQYTSEYALTDTCATEHHARSDERRSLRIGLRLCVRYWVEVKQ